MKKYKLEGFERLINETDPEIFCFNIHMNIHVFIFTCILQILFDTGARVSAPSFSYSLQWHSFPPSSHPVPGGQEAALALNIALNLCCLEIRKMASVALGVEFISTACGN